MLLTDELNDTTQNSEVGAKSLIYSRQKYREGKLPTAGSAIAGTGSRESGSSSGTVYLVRVYTHPHPTRRQCTTGSLAQPMGGEGRDKYRDEIKPK